MSSIKSLLVGFLIGILFAPDKGSETRKKIWGKMKNCKEDAEEALDEAAKKVKSTAGKIKENVEGAFG